MTIRTDSLPRPDAPQPEALPAEALPEPQPPAALPQPSPEERLGALGPEALALLQRHNLLRTLVQREVIATAVGGHAVSPEQLQQTLQAFCQQHRLADEAALQRYLANHGLTGEILQQQLRLPLQVLQHCREQFSHKAEARFLSRKNELDRVVYSLLRVKDPFLAQELYLRIAAGEANFADLAAQYAEGPERNTKGIIGPVPLTQAHPALAERLRTTSPGTLLEPMQLAEWFLVVRLESYAPASFNDTVADQMSRELFDLWVEEETTRIMASLPVQGASGAAA